MKKRYLNTWAIPKNTHSKSVPQKKVLALLLAAACLSQGPMGAEALAGNLDASYDGNRAGLLVKQGTEVRGRVVGPDGAGVPGATVVVKGTTTGTATDMNGNFTLNVPSGNGTLVVSFIGYKTQEVPINNRSTVNVSLAVDTKALEEVVVVGYGTQERADVTGAISSVTGEAMERVPTPTVAQQLQGQVPGVQVTANSGSPGAGSSIRIRGAGTIGNNNPLYVVDGVQVEGNINYLNSNDIATIEILKDASATAIYGSRAANGVVVVTTKKGKAGSPEINFSGYRGWQTPWRQLDMTNAAEYAALDNLARQAANIPTNPAWANPEALGEGTDYQEELFRTAPISNYQLSWSGGSDNSTFYVSAGYFQQDGIVIGSDFERYTFRINTDHKIGERVKIGNTLLLSTTDESLIPNNTDLNTGVLSRGIRQLPTVPVRNPDGSFAGPTSNFEGESENPVWLALESYNTDRNYRVLGSVYGEVEIVEDLVFRSNFNLDFNYFRNKNFDPAYAIGNRINNANSLSVNNSTFTGWQWSNLLNYEKTFGLHEVSVLAGIEAQENRYENNFARGGGFLKNDEIQFLNQATKDFFVSGGANESAIFSQLARVNYSYADKYLLTASVRRDGSSKFANNRYGVFPSASVGWRLSEEGFFRDNVDFVSNLKLRASWGETGNQNIFSNYPTYGVIVGDGRYALGETQIQVPGFYQAVQVNPDIRWETTVQTNFGLEAGFLSNKITFSADYFIKTTEDLLLQLPIPSSTGPGAAFTNAGSIRNRGWELALGYRNMDHEFGYSFNLNFTTIDNEVLDLGGLVLTEGNSRTQEGLPIAQFFGFETAGIIRTQEQLNEVQPIQPDAELGDIIFVDRNGDGQITGDDRTFIGNPLPDFTAGFTGEFTYKNFDLNFLFNSSFGNDIWSAISLYGYSADPGNKFSVLINNTFTPENPDAEFPRLIAGDPNNNLRPDSDRWIRDGSYIRLKNLQLGYNVPTAFSSKAKIDRLRVYVSAANLFTWTRYDDGFDPEIGSARFLQGQSNSVLEIGVDRGIYPQSRTFLVGVNIGI
ncbi:TonB-linked SusC/RagA family outer membrane protein [Pontibacter ummariensis]|uniref:TonB-linked outer membrane protein, SusC/RagA family n=1 Tax=Pontibacter ummariensis TaxID=1610492 RepID=A0A239B6U9_9BACT|nr:TonB-dependent receptor [Pontibacter ummariensis]PRY16351.1 TonB-linked SusC/RagA family outer membrane protein [Pontibacter ummariensis]SNS03606.1 TonB-linked outer membrane protein, SusC/RagA family [Pontibacter ummariensis]